MQDPKESINSRDHLEIRTRSRKGKKRILTWKAILASTSSGIGPTWSITLAKDPPSINSRAIVIDPSR